jgi:HSP20 family protein
MITQSATKQFLPSLQRSASTAFAPIQREFNRLFDELGNGWAAFTEFDLMPRIDVRETNKALELTVELPGIAQEDVKIAVEDDVLTISGEKKAEKETKEDNYRVAERSYGAFSRSITLPRSVDAENIKATMSDGVLKLVAPKQAGAEAKTIKIQAAR